MPVISDSAIISATRILRYRLTGLSSIDVTILDSTNNNHLSLNQNFGRFVGYFTIRPNGHPCFLLFVRPTSFSDFGYMFAFYVRSDAKTIQLSEKNQVRSSLPGLFTSPPTIETGVILVKTQAPRTCDLFLLLNAVEFVIGPKLTREFVPRHIINAQSGTSLISAQCDVKVPDCKAHPNQESVNLIWQQMDKLGLKVIRCENSLPFEIPSDFNILMTKYMDHRIYVINYAPLKTLMVLLTHICHFKTKECAKMFVTSIKMFLKPCDIKYVGAIRFFANSQMSCNSVAVLKACILAALSSPNIPMIIRESDVLTCVKDNDLKSILDRLKSSQESSKSSNIVVDDILESDSLAVVPYSSEDTNATTIIDVRFGGLDGDPDILSIQTEESSSQSTVIMTNEQIALELSLYQPGLREEMRGVLADEPPIYCHMKPMNDPLGDLLNNPQFFYLSLVEISALWHGYTTVEVAEPLTLDMLDTEFTLNGMQSRFIIVPVFDAEFTVLVIIDAQKEVWGFISPQNEGLKDAELFQEVEGVVRSRCKELSKMSAHPISITSCFHREYPMIHLLISVYNIGKLFKYAKMLPVKVIYTEKEFRGYCYRACLKLQLVNQLYNLNSGLIKPNGYLKPGAFRSISCPVTFERSVVPFDTCAFCKKRVYKNLGRHMSMKHGGQSESASDVRYKRYE